MFPISDVKRVRTKVFILYKKKIGEKMYIITNNYDKTSLGLGFVLGKRHQGDGPQIRGQQMRQALHVLGLFRQRAAGLALATLLLLQINLAGLHAVLKVLQCSGELAESL